MTGSRDAFLHLSVSDGIRAGLWNIALSSLALQTLAKVPAPHSLVCIYYQPTASSMCFSVILSGNCCFQRSAACIIRLSIV